MPSKYRIRNYKEDSFYHIYNKGLGKANIFLDESDYEKFLYYLEVYLSPSTVIPAKAGIHKDMDPRVKPEDDSWVPKRLLMKNLSNEVSLVAYLFLPDHFHLILHQKSTSGISKLLKQVINGYTYYFNSKYKNYGPLFSGKFKSVIIPEESLVSLTHYLHSHDGILWLADSLKSYPWSSHQTYVKAKSDFLSKQYVLSGFSSIKEYEKFIEGKLRDRELLKDLALD